MATSFTYTERNISVDDTDQNRRDHLREAASVIKSELDEQVTTVLDLKRSVSLGPTDILSDKVVALKNVPSHVRERIIESSQNLRRVIAGVAYFIEEEKIEQFDQMVAAYNGDLRHRERMEHFFSSQKKMMISYSSIHAVIDIFKRINQDVLSEFDTLQSNAVGSKQRAELHLKNAILVYEITSFVIGYLDQFSGLNGVKDFMAVKAEVLKEVTEAKSSIKKLMQSSNVSESLRAQRKNSQEARLKALEIVETRWIEIEEKISGQEHSVKKSKDLLRTLKYIRDDARSQIEVVGIVAATHGVGDAINSIEALTEDMLTFELKPLDEETVLSLLNISGH